MSKLLTYGSVGRATGNRCLYPEVLEVSNQPQYTGFILIFGRSKSFILKRFFKRISLDFKHVFSSN